MYLSTPSVIQPPDCQPDVAQAPHLRKRRDSQLFPGKSQVLANARSRVKPCRLTMRSVAALAAFANSGLFNTVSINARLASSYLSGGSVPFLNARSSSPSPPLYISARKVAPCALSDSLSFLIAPCVF